MTGETGPLLVAVAGFAVIGAIAVSVVANDSPAESAASKPTAPQRGLVSQRHVEKAPVVADTVPGDGTWIIGKELKRGTYRTAGSAVCLWQRLGAQVAGQWVVIDGAFKPGTQTVALGKDDVAFVSVGCPAWELVR